MKKVIWLVLGLCFVASLALAQGMVKEMAVDKPGSVAGGEVVADTVTSPVVEAEEVVINKEVMPAAETDEMEAVEEKVAAPEAVAPVVESKEVEPAK
ncbi:MAG TPA: hypothetical protein PL155_08580 [Candidatus Omnitrophota bacterium]|nr:hypothetical protein [Candidatus Omnitrophota bacterium]HPD85490.1 hypothetical protein [Candidatus Omnitrophota bacterium]HRZ04009.1 hypothetical protein [Candidatus Omnitrophota bacterium]